MFGFNSFPKAIIHVDGDSFFASCEVAKNPFLRGKPVVTGKERGIASSMTYEAKARGVTRGMRLFEIKKVCPEAIILPSDYETYSLYSERMYRIVKRYTPDVDEYSIDECFADITGLRRLLKMSYEKIAESIKYDLDTELGMTFSVGLSVNKVLAKVGSKWKKPSGLTIIPREKIREYLGKVSVGKIWGIGENTTAHMNKLQIKTALDLASKDKMWVKDNFTKPIQEIHSELLGEFVYPLTFGLKTNYASISKTRTFTPPSKDKKFVLSQLSKNVENACIKSRRYGLFSNKFSYFLKTQDFKYFGKEIDLKIPTSVPQDIMEVILKSFDELFDSNVLYRATGITLLNLRDNPIVTMDLFGSSLQNTSLQEVYNFTDKISLKYGKHSVFLCSSLSAMSDSQHGGDRGDLCLRKKQLLKGETNRQRLGIPFLGEAR